MYQKPKLERFGTFHELSMKSEEEAADPAHPLLRMLSRDSGELRAREFPADEASARKRSP